MPKGCTSRAACGGDCFDDDEHRWAMQWAHYWNSLDDAGKERERQMMDAYAAEVNAERKLRGFDA